MSDARNGIEGIVQGFAERASIGDGAERVRLMRGGQPRELASDALTDEQRAAAEAVKGQVLEGKVTVDPNEKLPGGLTRAQLASLATTNPVLAARYRRANKIGG